MSSRNSAIMRFNQARRNAQIEQFSARLAGRETELLPFDLIRNQLRRQNPLYRGIREIPLKAIAGSVGRYQEFTRNFLPLSDSLRERWVGVDSLAETEGWPPIDVYQIGEVYFVKDGNHRVSVSRQLDIPTIEAHVWEYPDDLQLKPDSALDEVFIQLGERHFMEKTGLNDRFPDHGIRFTIAGRYTDLLAQIHTLRQSLAQIDGEEMAYEEAVDAWYEMVYLPTVQIIRESTLLEDFEGRTETDLFVWLYANQESLQKLYGSCANLSDLAAAMAQEYKESGIEKLKRQAFGLLGNKTLPPLRGDWGEEE